MSYKSWMKIQWQPNGSTTLTKTKTSTDSNGLNGTEWKCSCRSQLWSRKIVGIHQWVTTWVFSFVRSCFYYRPQRSWAKVMFLQASVILSTGGRGVSGRENPPSRETPPAERAPPLARRTPRARRTPLPGKENPPPGQGEPPSRARRTPPAGRPPGQGDTPPSIRSMSGRYASYWNAFLSYVFSYLEKNTVETNQRIIFTWHNQEAVACRSFSSVPSVQTVIVSCWLWSMVSNSPVTRWII